MISLEWVSDYIDISDQDLKELAVKITQSGINVEKVITNHIDNLVIGKDAFSSKDKPLLIYEQTDNEPRRQAVPRGTSSD